MVLHKSDIYGGYDGFQSTVARCTRISAAGQPSCPASVLLPVCACVLYVIQKLRAFISLTHQHFSFYLHIPLSFPSVKGSGHALQGAVAYRKREREGERVEGEGGGCLQTDNTLNHRWLSKVARE